MQVQLEKLNQGIFDTFKNSTLHNLSKIQGGCGTGTRVCDTQECTHDTDSCSEDSGSDL